MKNELCVKTQKECGYLNFFIDFNALIQQLKIKSVNELETALKDYEMEHTLRIRLENINFDLVHVLKIIKEKQVDIPEFLRVDSVVEYNNKHWSESLDLTKTVFDLLKEYLK